MLPTIPHYLFWPLMAAAILGTTYAAAYVFFVTRKIRPSNSKNMLVGALGAIVPGIWVGFAGSADDLEASGWDATFVVLVIMGFWGSSFGALLAAFFARFMVTKDDPPEETFK